ncbi:MAG: RagB/SusD family nutrient uptake outer membrane protein [Bacteroidetes bacterium]|nr:RagB/SusD family nutrient uptake outer membrane protein [Bacteroidota bacterium]
MKKIYKRILPLSMIFCLLACADLDLVNPNAATEDSFWQTEQDLYQGVIATYDYLQATFDEGSYGLELRVFPQLLSDEGTNEAPWEFNDLARFVQDDLNMFGNIYTGGYRMIGRAYQVIDRAEGISGSQVLRLVAEAKFFVALGYYNLLTGFGDRIPFVDRIQGADEKPMPATAGQLWAMIETYLTDAIPALPLASEVGVLDYGRISKGSAQTLLAKIYLQQGNYTAAEPLLAAVVNSGQYQLLADFSENFRETDQVNPEAVFHVNFLHNGIEGETDNSAHWRFNSPSEIKGHYGDVQSTNFVLNSFLQELDADGNQDPRMDRTLFWEGSSLLMYGLTHAGWISAAEPANPDVNHGYYKYNESEFVGSSQDALRSDGGIDFLVWRYADVLLLYAETLNQNGNTAAAYQYVDEVRVRSNMSPLSVVAPGLSQADFLQQIKHERLMELAGEGIRWFDQKRWGDYGPSASGDHFIPSTGTSVAGDPNFNDPITGKGFTVGQDELFAIPQNELDLNPNLIQNPGY